ncbi:MAG: hypothetical protein HRU17_12385 [Polyangiaceae bacterium]|nr:hypothetical protein [Polyangiaceae bacterium]
MVRAAINLGTYLEQPQAVPPIAMMTWDPLIAEKSQSYATSVTHWDDGHSSDAYRNYTSTYHTGDHGENMAIGTGSYADPDEFVGASWAASEAVGCTGSSCGGHYTQIVWDDSIAVGCGSKDNVPFESNEVTYYGTLSVCQYGAAGNYGGEPYSF